MDNKELSRREALKLAQLGTLLGAGLCVAESAEASPQKSEELLRSNRIQIKLESKSALGLIQSSELPQSVLEKIAGDGSVRVYFKFVRERGGEAETLHAETLQIKWNRR